MRTEVDPGRAGADAFYRLLTAVVVPRPIAWVSTTSDRTGAGVANLAPHSFFTVACVDPPVVQFTSVGRKDTLRNVEATGQFVVSLAPEPMLHQVNATATAFPAGVGEFTAVGVAQEPSRRVAPPRVAGSPVALECELHAAVPVGGCTLVLGRVVLAAVAEEVLVEGVPDVRRLAPLARLGDDAWSTVGEVRALARTPYRP